MLALSVRGGWLDRMALVPVSRPVAAAAVEGTSWRLVLGRLAASVPVTSTAEAVRVAETVAAACGADADGHLRLDLRADAVEVVLQTAEIGRVTDADIALSRRIGTALDTAGLALRPPASSGGRRSVQVVEIAIDAMDIPAVRPFWRAVLGYTDPPGTAPYDDVVDQVGQGPAVWFQQMDEPRPQRNRIHLDVAVPHDEAPARVRAALDAGGVMVNDGFARAFWVLADVEGNEVCVCTWQDRDPAGDTA